MTRLHHIQDQIVQLSLVLRKNVNTVIPKMGKCVLVNRSFKHFPRKTLSFQIIEQTLQVDQIFGETKKAPICKIWKTWKLKWP